MKPEFFSFDAGEDVSVEKLAERILSIEGLNGVSFSGGEPFEQADALGELARRLKRHGLTVLSYSGYRVDALRREPRRFGSLLTELDILIDGEYRRELNGPFRWLGSENQVIHTLSDHQSDLPPLGEASPRQEIQFTFSEHGMRMSGFPSQQMQDQLEQALGRRGIVLSRS